MEEWNGSKLKGTKFKIYITIYTWLRHGAEFTIKIPPCNGGSFRIFSGLQL